MNDFLVFRDDDEEVKRSTHATAPWRILIVDDEPDIHDVTKIALAGFEFGGAPLEFLHAYSGAEARDILAREPDIALVLLDVIMESDDAGLNVVEHVRNDLENSLVRIVLRTGNPGQAPERRVITDFDINDYKEKSELTAQKLFTLMHGALCSYRDIRAIKDNKRGLETVIEATADIFRRRSVHQFAGGVLKQLTALLHGDREALLMEYSGLSAMVDDEGRMHVLAATGRLAEFSGQIGLKGIPDHIRSDIEVGMRNSGFLRIEDRFVASFRNCLGQTNILHLSGVHDISGADHKLLELFSRNVGIAFENLRLHEDLEATQREICYMLGEAVETRSRETGIHVRRVAEICEVLARELGLGDEQAELIKMAAPLHDVGKIGIPDSILNKPGKLDADEWETMKRHTEIGSHMLGRSQRPILKAASIIARDHHEKWDGSGYPANKSGEDIHIFGRIAALADVFDALGSDRSYKKAWPLNKTVALIEEERGQHFDPRVVDAFLAQLPAILEIRDNYLDAAA
ncbi:MAG: DUF3369 domain-containing protein [Rhodospirillales bacterium]|nr:DUF3369 domain-containing protein [Rhodospirillales bacterium]